MAPTRAALALALLAAALLAAPAAAQPYGWWNHGRRCERTQSCVPTALDYDNVTGKAPGDAAGCCRPHTCSQPPGTAAPHARERAPSHPRSHAPAPTPRSPPPPTRTAPFLQWPKCTGPFVLCSVAYCR